MTSKPSLTLYLDGPGGNAFAILAACHRAVIRDNTWSESDWQLFTAEAKSKDYDHLLDTVKQRFTVTFA